MFAASPWRGSYLERDLKLQFCVTLARLPSGAFECNIDPYVQAPAIEWGVTSEGRTMSEAFMRAAWSFERLEEANPSLLHTDYPALHQRARFSSEFVLWRPPR